LAQPDGVFITLAIAANSLPAITARARNVFDRHGVAILTLILLVILAALLARWTWFFMQPKEAAAPVQGSSMLDLNSAAANIVNAHIFGVAGEARSPDSAQVSTLNVRLKGVFAFNQDTPAFAIVNTGAKNDEPFKAGDEIMSGVVLDGVYPGHILIKRGGVIERVNLEERAGGPVAAPRTQFKPIPPPAAAAPAPNSFNLSRSEIQKSLQDPKQLANLGRVNANPGGGVLVEEVPTGSMAQQLGLQPGDVIRSINGNAVNAPTDLGRLYQRVGESGQVRVEGTRAGKPLNLTYNMHQ
jgi:general secretion pathway protein C